MSYLTSQKFIKDLIVLFLLAVFFLGIPSYLFISETTDPSNLPYLSVIIFIFLFISSFYFFYNLPILSNSKEAKEEVVVKSVIIFIIISSCLVLIYLVV